MNAGPLTDTSINDGFADLTGALSGNDRDGGETASLTYAVLDATDQPVTTVAGHYGSLTVNANGSYDYVPDAAAINALPAGDYTDTFTVQTTDVHGATGTATLTVHVTGANDTPVVAAALTDNVNEGDAAFTRDLLNGASDVDHGATLHIANVSYAVDGGAGSATAPAGVSLDADGHTLAVDPADPSFDLMVGEYTTIVVSYDVTDAQGATVAQTETITVAGTDDTPTLTINALTSDMDDPGEAPSRTIVASAPDETLTGHVGRDTFVFNFTGVGHDTVTDFHPGTDTLQFGSAIFATAQAALNATLDDGAGNTVISLDSHDTITLAGVLKAQLQAADFHVA